MSRMFSLVRERDVTGISGTGVVAEGIEFSDGVAVIRWLDTATARSANGVRPTTVHHESIGSVIALHGHGRSTYIEFEDGTRIYQEDK